MGVVLMDPRTKNYFSRFERDVLPLIKKSAVTVAIGPDDPDAKMCLELGAALLYDKPIVVVIPPGRHVPANLKRVASLVLEGDHDDPAFQRKFTKALSDLLEKDKRTKGGAQ